MTLPAQPLTASVTPVGISTTPHLNMTLPHIAPSAYPLTTNELPPQNEAQKIFGRMHHAARLVREGFPYEALSEFENILNQWRRAPKTSFAVFAVKAAYNRAVLFETILSDNARALIAFEEVFKLFQDHETSEIKTVALRAGLHAARLVGAKKNYPEAVARYHGRLSLATDLLPPRELGAFVDHFQRMTERTKAHQTAAANQPVVMPEEMFKAEKSASWTAELRREWADLRALVRLALDRSASDNLKPPEQFLDTVKNQHKETLDLVHSRSLDLKDQQLMMHSLMRKEFQRVYIQLQLLRRISYGVVIALGVCMLTMGVVLLK